MAARRAVTTPADYLSVAPLRDEIEARLTTRFGAVVNGTAPRAPHVTNLSFEGWAGAELVAALDLEGVLVSSGAACSAGTSEPSPVVSALAGVPRARAAVRISLGPRATHEMLREVTEAFERVLRRGPTSR